MINSKVDKIKCELCGKLSREWYWCYGKYFCKLKHLEEWELKNKLPELEGLKLI
jgi:hypothetical protein